MELYNSLTKKKEEFKSLKKGRVAMYNCGPTVYDYAHIGNWRAYLLADLLRRYLELKKYRVKQVMNITDVGHMVADAEAGTDKMEAAAARDKKTPWQIAEFYTKSIFHDLDALKIERAWKYPRATKHVKEMIKIIKVLLKKGYAYKVNGSAYYDVTKFKHYGQLSGNKVEDLLPGARVEINPEKRNPCDFALWVEDPKHLMQWKAPWSIKAGYPGWHIECSAMAMKYLGPTIDIHTGGEDNKFPHHECEIAQSEGATGKKFADYWLHVKHLLVDGEKMSKSLNNFYTLQELLSKGYSWREIRYLLLSTHYRETLNFTFAGLIAARGAIERLDQFVLRINQELKSKSKSKVKIGEMVKRAQEDFAKALDDDLNVSEAWAAVFQLIREVNSKLDQGIHFKDLTQVKKFIAILDQVFGLEVGKAKNAVVPETIKNLLQKREQARKNEDWKLSDEIRGELEKSGYLVKDTPEGQQLKKVSSI